MTETLLGRVLSHAAAHPRAPALDSPTVKLDYGGLVDRVRALASALRERGLSPGERVLVALPSIPGAVVVTLAIQALGAIPVEVNREGGRPMLQAAWEKCAGIAFVSGRDARHWGELFRAAPPRHVWVHHGGPLDERLLRALGVPDAATLGEDGSSADPVNHPLAPVSSADDAPALILFTSGSTGEPRGVIHTKKNVAANTQSIVEYLGLGAADRALLVLPYAYTFGRSVVQTHLWVGGSIFFDPRFMYPSVVVDALATEACSTFSGVPLTFEHLRKHVDPSRLRLPKLRHVTQAGGAASPSLVRWMVEAFAPASVFVMYGQTEATARLTYVPPSRTLEKPGSIGVPIPGVTLEIVDDAGAPVERGAEGHLVARGDNVTPGYLDAAGETAAILKDGWLHTGDLARRDDDGFFFLVGRTKDIVKIGGRRVNPAEIEPILRAQPGVEDAAVVDVPDGDERALVAAVVTANSVTLDAGDLQRACRSVLPAWLVPRRVVFVAELPRTANGKIDKTALREQLSIASPKGEP